MDEYKQGMILEFNSRGNAKERIDQTAKSLQGMSEVALDAAKQLSKLFSNEDIKKATNYEKAIRSFERKTRNAGENLKSVLSSRTVKELGESFSKLTFDQSSTLKSFFEAYKNELLDWSKYTGEITDHLEKMFSKDQIQQAKEMASTMRSFNESWEKDTFNGMYLAVTAESVEQLAEGFANMSASQASAIANAYKEPEQEFKDFSEIALTLAGRLSTLFTKEDIDKAAAMAKALRDFNEGWTADTETGIAQLGAANNITSLTEAFSKLSSSQVSTIKALFEEPAIALEDFATSAQIASNYLSNMFTKEEVKRAQELADAMRKFNEGWKPDTKAGLSAIKSSQTVEKLAEGFSKLTSGQASAIAKLYTETEEAASPIMQKYEEFSKNVQKSLTNFRHGIDRIANIIRYRLIRQGLSLIVSQLNEGTKNIYIFARAFRQLDKNNIAENLDKYATALDKIRGNLGAAWATTLSALSGLLIPFLDRISAAIEKVTAFASAMNNSSTYMKVATDNVKRYYDAVASGLQDIKVLGSQTRFDEALVPDEVSSFADKVRENLSSIGDISSAVAAGLAILLIGTGHIVAGLEVGAVALGISKITKDSDLDSENTTSGVESKLRDIQKYVGAFEAAIGLLLIFHGHPALGIAALVNGVKSLYSGSANDLNLGREVEGKLKALEKSIESFQLAIGILLLCAGNPFGFAFLAAYVGDKVVDLVSNWDDVKTSLSRLGNVISEWWNNTFIKGIKEPWEDFWSDPFKLNKYKTKKADKEAIENGTASPEQLIRYSKDRSNQVKRTFELGETLQAFLSEGFLAGLEKLFTTTFPTLKAYANGGFPSAGSIFLAGEVPGQTELLGTINGRTGVAGGAEITGIREAIYEVGAEILSSMQNNNVNVTLEGDADRLFKVVRSKAVEYNRKTGEFAF